MRVAARDGLHAVTMRAVAAEAGMSLNLVQYYFDTKAQLVHSALLHLEHQSHERWAARLESLNDPETARACLEAFVAEAVPTDEASRAFRLVWTSYAVLAMTDPELAEQPFIEGPNRLERQLTEVLARAQKAGRIAAHLDVSIEATRLLSLSHGVGTSVLVGQRSATQALEVMHYHLARLFSDPTPLEAP
ncbi:TetR family transcriptional regulator [Streptomyces sparsogenes DSM 40356]|uniref:TetR family transcriptional regulator n=1 Tax=Streptomyces sparsogenes DSM 40356 TaxID=1331668 RepID=A0A1R1SNP3_9ACTN|nr:TetR family transcriptional regulator [Streptomyces sparsogenes DSM 40356]